MKKLLMDFYRDEDGLETVEMVIILVVIVGIAFAFRRSLVKWFNNQVEAWSNTDTGTDLIKESNPKP